MILQNMLALIVRSFDVILLLQADKTIYNTVGQTSPTYFAIQPHQTRVFSPHRITVDFV